MFFCYSNISAGMAARQAGRSPKIACCDLGCSLQLVLALGFLRFCKGTIGLGFQIQTLLSTELSLVVSETFPICTRRLQFGDVRASSPWSSRFASDGWSSGTFARRQCTVPVFHALRCNDCSAFRLAPLAALIIAQRFGSLRSPLSLLLSVSARCSR